MAANILQVSADDAPAVLSKSDAAAVLDAVRETRGARSTVTVVAGAATAPLRRHHHFKFGFTSGVVPYEMEGEGENVKILKVALAETGELVPATSLCQFVRQAASEMLEVYREIQRRGLRMPRELPIDAPYKEAVGTFTGIDKGLRKWLAYQELSEYGHADRVAFDCVPGEPSGRILSFLVDAAAIAELAQRQATAGAAGLALGQALADDALGHALRFVGALPRNDDEAIAILKYQCSTDCGGTGADGTYLEVAESEDPTKGRLLAEVILFSTHEGDFSRLEPRAERPTDNIPSPDYATLRDAPPEAVHDFMRVRCAQTGPADDFYTFATAGASEPVVSLPSQWLLRKNAEFERLKQRIRELMPGLAW